MAADLVVPVVDQLFTATNILSLGIATSAVSVTTNALYKLAKLPQKWTSFVISLVIAYMIVFMSSSPEWYNYILAFFNACLLFCSALGANEFTAAIPDSGSGFARRDRFFKSWIHANE